MSQDFDNSERFSLFENKRKEKDTHPDFTGTLNHAGKDFFLDCWIPKKFRRQFDEFVQDNPGFFFSGKIGKEKSSKGGGYGGKGSSAPRQRRELSESMPQRQSTRGGTEAYDDDDIPFRQFRHKEY